MSAAEGTISAEAIAIQNGGLSSATHPEAFEGFNLMIGGHLVTVHEFIAVGSRDLSCVWAEDG